MIADLPDNGGYSTLFDKGLYHWPLGLDELRAHCVVGTKAPGIDPWCASGGVGDQTAGYKLVSPNGS